MVEDLFFNQASKPISIFCRKKSGFQMADFSMRGVWDEFYSI